MLKTPEEIINFINFSKEFINSNKKKILVPDKKFKSRSVQPLVEGSPRITQRWLWGFGTNAYAAARGYLMLNDRENAMNWFNKSSEFYFQCIKSYNETGQYFGVSKTFTETAALQVMKSCMLSGNKGNINEISYYIIENKPEISLNSDLIYNYVLALSMMIGDETIDDNDNDLHKQIKKLAASEKTHGKDVTGYYVGTADALKGIAENNKEKIFKGINKILFSFSKYLPRTKEVPLCIDAIMLLLITKNKLAEIDMQDIDKKYQKYVSLCLLK